MKKLSLFLLIYCSFSVMCAQDASPFIKEAPKKPKHASWNQLQSDIAQSAGRMLETITHMYKKLASIQQECISITRDIINGDYSCKDSKDQLRQKRDTIQKLEREIELMRNKLALIEKDITSIS